MASSWLDSFSVALGFEVDTASLNTAKKSVADYEKAVRDAEKRIEDARWEGAKSEEEIAKLSRETNLKEARAALANAQDKEKSEKDLAKKRQDRAREFATAMSKMALAATAAATAIGYAVAKVSSSFDNLYFQAQRAGTSVQSLKALGYAFSQTGGTAQQAGAAVDSFTTALRNNPGLRQFVKDLGVSDSLQGVDKLLATVDALKKEPYEVGVQHAGMLGISEENFNLMVRQGEALKAYRAEYDQTTKLVGLNSEEAAKAATSFQRSMTRLQATVSALGEKLLISLAPTLNRVVDAFQNWLTSNPEALERIIKSITDAIIFFTTKLDELIKSWGADGGAAFIKKWDEFAERTERIAASLERMVIAGGKLAGFINAINQYEVTPGAGTVSTWLLNKLGLGSGAGSTGGPLGVGAVGGFNPLEGGAGGQGGGDRRNWWQRNMPKVLGGKEARSGDIPTGSSAGNLTALIEAEAKRANIDPRIMQGIRAGESGHRADYDVVDNAKESSWGPFQLNRRGGLGAQFEKETGLDVRDPKTIAAQARWVAEYIYKGGNLGAWRGFRGPREADPSWGDSGYVPQGNEPRAQPPVNGVGGVEQTQGGAQHRPEAISALLHQQIAAAAAEAKVNAQVYSGGQEEDSPNRTGSHRHDHGNAADLRLYTLGADGKRRYLDMQNEADRPVMEAFLRNVVKQGATGIGAGPGYMGGSTNMHVGGGPVAAWGAGGSSANAPDWVRRALAQGLEDRAKPASQPVAAPARVPAINMTPGGFDVNKIDPRDLMKAPPMGAGGVTNTSTSNKAVTQHITSNTTIHEARNTKEAGRVMEGAFGRMHSMALSNAQSAVG